MINIIGWIGTIGFIVGVCLLGKKKKAGFIINTIANILYLYIGIKSNLSSIAVLSLILTIINIKGYIEWSKIDKNYESRYFNK